MGKEAREGQMPLPLPHRLKSVCLLQMLSKTSVDEVFMYHFEKISSASGVFAPRPSPGFWTLLGGLPSFPLIAYPWKKSCGRPCPSETGDNHESAALCEPRDFFPSDCVVVEVYKHIHLSEQRVIAQLQRLRAIVVRDDVPYLCQTHTDIYDINRLH